MKVINNGENPVHLSKNGELFVIKKGDVIEVEADRFKTIHQAFNGMEPFVEGVKDAEKVIEENPAVEPVAEPAKPVANPAKRNKKNKK